MKPNGTLLEMIDSHLKSQGSIVALRYDETFHPRLGDDHANYKVITPLPIESNHAVSYVAGPAEGYRSIDQLNAFMNVLLPEGVRPNQRWEFERMLGNWLKHGHLLVDERTFGHQRGSNGAYLERTIITVLPYAPTDKAMRRIRDERHLLYQTPMEQLELSKAAGFE